MNKFSASIDSPGSDILEPTFWGTFPRGVTHASFEQTLARLQSRHPQSFLTDFVQKPYPVRLHLPLTLVKEKKGGPTLLYTEASGLVTKTSSIQYCLCSGFSMFLVKSGPPRRGYPWFLGTGGTHVCFSETEALPVYENCEVLQKYVFSKPNGITKYRVHWTHPNSFKCLVYKQKCESDGTVASSLFKHSTRNYNYAGRLLKSSFSLHFPFRSGLKTRRSTCKLPRLSEQKRTFFIDPSTAEIHEEPVSLQLKEAILQLVLFYNNFSESRQNPTELMAEFILSEDNQYVLLDCVPLLTPKKRLKILLNTELDSVSNANPGSYLSDELNDTMCQLNLRLSKLQMEHELMSQQYKQLKVRREFNRPKLRIPKIRAGIHELNTEDTVVEEASNHFDSLQAKVLLRKKEHHHLQQTLQVKNRVLEALEKARLDNQPMAEVTAAIQKSEGFQGKAFLQSIFKHLQITSQPAQVFLQYLFEFKELGPLIKDLLATT